jgi:hypothetical protein
VAARNIFGPSYFVTAVAKENAQESYIVTSFHKTLQPSINSIMQWIFCSGMKKSIV